MRCEDSAINITKPNLPRVAARPPICAKPTKNGGRYQRPPLSLFVLELPSGYDSSIVMLLITSRSAGEEFSPPRLRVTGELASVSSTSPPSVSIPKMV